ncbi:MAG: hypothetical protein LBT97_08205, partial [Planctomycetota bacterium]|nr:hypothetical protein [Planctomycetota bacterium]
MPDGWTNVVDNSGSGVSRPGGQSALPAPGSVVMANVEEDHGDGVYAIRWAGNRLNVASRIKLSAGSSLMLKAELSPEGKTLLVIQGPALPASDLPLVAAGYGPSRPRLPEPQPRNVEPPAGDETASPGRTPSLGGGSPGGAGLKPLLERLPDLPENSATLLKAAAAELERLVGKAAEAARDGSERPPPPEPPTRPAVPPSTAPAAPLPGGAPVDALRQLAKAAELPLGGEIAEIVADSGARASVPEAVADRAASILLTAAGLTPDPATLEAAKILMRDNARVDRQSIQLMSSLAAGTEGAGREALLKATARLLAHDVPIAQPVASGLAAVLSREAGVAELLANVQSALSGPVPVPAAAPLVDAARELLAMLAVDLAAEDAPAALERFVSSFGREALARALSLVEAAAQAALEDNPELSRIDAALAEVLARLAGDTVPGRAQPELPAGVPPALGGESATATPPREALPHPGVNPPEFELLRPGGLLDQYLAGGPRVGRPDFGEAGEAVAELLSASPERRQRAARELANREQPFLRELSSRLLAAERAALRADPFLTRLAAATNSLRELGRQFIAVKAENLAGQDRNPGVTLAEAPFRLNDSGGDGRMQMFHRRGGAAKGGWSSRVILDLNTTALGPVLGDLRFFGKDLVVNLFVGKQETADFLARESGGLTDRLLGKGFRLKARFLVLP